jgi:hypothetical protein
VPRDRVRAAEAAFLTTLKDPEFVAEAEKRRIPFNRIPGTRRPAEDSWWEPALFLRDIRKSWARIRNVIVSTFNCSGFIARLRHSIQPLLGWRLTS